MHIFAAGTQVLAPYGAQRAHDWNKEYVAQEELRHMRLSPGSPLLAAVLERLAEPFEMWIPGDPGVDEKGFYRLHPQPLEHPGESFGAEYQEEVMPWNHPPG